jgi:hypothetical protein
VSNGFWQNEAKKLNDFNVALADGTMTNCPTKLTVLTQKPSTKLASGDENGGDPGARLRARVQRK